MAQVRFNVDQLSLLEKQEDVAEQAQVLTELTRRIRESVYKEDVLKTTVKEVRRALQTERVVIVGLNPINWDGLVVAECAIRSPEIGTNA